MENLPIKPADITEAAATIAGLVIVTACNESRTLGEICGCRIWLKFENLQFTPSSKERAALNCLSSLSAEQRQRGVIAMSAGNHAQGVAYHAQRLGIPTTIVMPEGTPFNKVERTASFGARILIQGESIDSAAVFARDLAA